MTGGLFVCGQGPYMMDSPCLLDLPWLADRVWSGLWLVDHPWRTSSGVAAGTLGSIVHASGFCGT